MKVENFSALESQVLSLINNDINTFETILNQVSFNEKLLNQTLEGLISKNILVFDNGSKKYKYSTPVDKEVVILDGNLLLPTTIIKIPEQGIMYVTRGEWYKFPIDFDIRRIIWNVKIPSKNNSTLVDLIKTSVLKQRKSSIKHNPEYDNIRKKSVPYCKNYNLFLNDIGDELTDVNIHFKIVLDEKDSLSPIHKGFSVNTQISTKELIDELSKPVNERNYQQNIKVNKIFNFSDFIFKDNDIPLNFDVENKELQYVKITTNSKKGMTLVYYKLDSSGTTKKLDEEKFDDINEAYIKLRNLFSGFASSLLVENDFLCEYDG